MDTKYWLLNLKGWDCLSEPYVDVCSIMEVL